MTNTIKLYQAKSLINQSNVDDLIYVDEVSSDEDYSEIIFKSGLNDQLYSFYSYGYGMTVNTVQGFNTFLSNNDNNNFDVRVAPVKKVTEQITVAKYVGED